MKQSIMSRLFYLSIFLVLTSFNNATSTGSDEAVTINDLVVKDIATTNKNSTSAMLYEKLNLQNAGLSLQALEAAVKGYEKLVEDGIVTNTQYLAIVDFSQSSRKKRFYLLDVKNQELTMNTFVAHGKNSGVDKAVRFSNTPQSEASSLGFYVTKQTYRGKHGLSLKLQGMENGFNDNAEARAIVMHGADYVNPARVHSAYMGRSQGCPALPEAVAPKVINMVKGGSVLFVYNPSKRYLNNSKLLNS